MSCFLGINSNNQLTDEKCSEIENLKLTDLDKYIRLKLGQRVFPTPKMKECMVQDKNNRSNCNNCKNCKYNEWYYTWKKEGHLKLDFDSRKFIKKNYNILELFNEYFDDIKVVIHSYQGAIEAYFIKVDDYLTYNYWEQSYNNMTFPYITKIDLTELGTVEIIKTVIERIQKIKNGCQKLGNCGYKCDTLCDACLICENGIIPSIFNFKMKKITLFQFKLLETTRIIPLRENEDEIIIDCENNFSEDEINLIHAYKINKIEDLLIHEKIGNIDKFECLKYYKMVRENYKWNGYEVMICLLPVQFYDYRINLIILGDGSIKYFNSLGKKSITIFNCM